MSLLRTGLYEFGPFRLDVAEQLLLRAGEPVPLKRKEFETLLVLVENSGRLVEKEKFFEEVWPGTAVEDGSLTVSISNLRKALGRDERGRQYIETVPRRGYRFSADVQALGGNGKHLPPPHPMPRRRWGIAATVMLAVAALVTAGIIALRGGNTQARTFAILPFDNLKPEPESDFLRCSLAYAVGAKLGNVRALVVRPPASACYRYRSQQVDPLKAAEELKVNTLLSGSYLKEGDRLHINAQLIDVPSNRVLWQDSFSLKYEQLSDVQERISRHVINGLALKLTPEEASRFGLDSPNDPRAYEYYLRGVDFYYAEDYLPAIAALGKSVEIDPQYPRAWALLGSAYSVHGSLNFGGREFYAKAQGAYERALALNPRMVEAKAFLADLLVDTNRFEQATRLMREALEAEPDHALAHWELAYAYRFGGMLDESIAEGERSRELDPTLELASAPFSAYLYSGRYEEFVAGMHDPEESALLLFYRGLARYYMKDLGHAAADFRRSHELDPSLLASKIGIALLHGLEGRGEEGLKVLREAEVRVDASGVIDGESIYKIAQGYAALGDRASALRMLRRSIEGGFVCYPYFTRDKLLESVHGEPEFAELLEAARRRQEAYKKEFFEGTSVP